MNCDLQVEQISTRLVGKTIAFCVTGSIAAIETPKIVRQLRRHGATVFCYMTEAATQFITPLPLEWASGNPVHIHMSGLAEHICTEDMVIVAPCTANTINKVTAGICDNIVTLKVKSALGMRKKVLIAPAMHESLAKNEFSPAIEVVKGRVSEGKIKLAKNETIVDHVIRACTENTDNRCIKILVTGGPTFAPMDDVRGIINIFRGRFGIEIAKELWFHGYSVTLLLGTFGRLPNVPSYLNVIPFSTYEEYKEKAVEQAVHHLIGVYTAAVADYAPKKVDGKIASQGNLTLELENTEKVIGIIRERFPQHILVSAKVIDGHIATLGDIMRDRLEKGHQAVIGNTLTMTKEGTVVFGHHVPEKTFSDGSASDGWKDLKKMSRKDFLEAFVKWIDTQKTKALAEMTDFIR